VRRIGHRARLHAQFENFRRLMLFEAHKTAPCLCDETRADMFPLPHGERHIVRPTYPRLAPLALIFRLVVIVIFSEYNAGFSNGK